MKPHILYEDNHLLVVVKPFNIPVQADISGDMDLLTFYKQYLKQTYHKPGDAYLGLVHRLDRPTGGVMVFAKTSKMCIRDRNMPVFIKPRSAMPASSRDRQTSPLLFLSKSWTRRWRCTCLLYTSRILRNV